MPAQVTLIGCQASSPTVAMGKSTQGQSLLSSVPTILPQLPSSQSHGCERALPIPWSTPILSLLSPNLLGLPASKGTGPGVQDLLHEDVLPLVPSSTQVWGFQ